MAQEPQANSLMNGPSKHDLNVAFFNKVTGMRLPLNFRVKGPNFAVEQPIQIVVNQLSWEDGSGESWLFEGYIPHMTGSTHNNVTGWYHTVRRIGWLQFTHGEPRPDADFMNLIDRLKAQRGRK